MAVHGISHIVGDMLGYPRVHVAFEDAYEVCAQRHTERHEDEEYQLVDTAPDKSLIDYLTCQHRGEQVEDGGNDYRRKHNEHLLPVGL